MDKYIIIPARIESTRLPGKMLEKVDDKPIIRHAYETVLAATTGYKVIVATDSTEIKNYFCRDECVMTEKCNSGSERVWRAAEILKCNDSDLVINYQVDNPYVGDLDLFKKLEKITKRGTIGTAHYSSRVKKNNSSEVKIVLGKDNRILYSSRANIPYGTEDKLIHIGVYSFIMSDLRYIHTYYKKPINKSEDLEQNSWTEQDILDLQSVESKGFF